MSTPERFTSLLTDLTADRRAHSVEVGHKVEQVARLVDADERQATIDAAYLHDVGYAHPVSGFHPLDGARFLSERGYYATVCQLVAHHSGGVVEASPARHTGP